ncbi:MAG TPA: hypothetical protein VFP84_30195 [Kofleriaceae bacterium]|nr:hypothetical protein [Kofleriaceae bacterium]
MAAPAGEQEDLDTPDGTSSSRQMQRANSVGLSGGARIMLYLGVAAFTVSSLLPGLIMLWTAILVAACYGTAKILLHTGGLDAPTLTTGSAAAAVIDLGLLLVIGIAMLRAHRRAASQGGRHPILTASGWLVTSLLVIAAFGWQHAPSKHNQLASTAVLANVYFFVLLGFVSSLRLTVRICRRVRDWSRGSQFRTGFLTAGLLLAATESARVLASPADASAIDDLEARLQATTADGEPEVVRLELSALCIAADDIEPVLAGAASGCRFSDRESSRNDCFASLTRDAFSPVTRTLRSRIRGAYNHADLEDALMAALIATCTRQPPPTNLVAYFTTVANHQLMRTMQRSTRQVAYGDLESISSIYDRTDSVEVSDAKVEKIWACARREISAQALKVLDLRLQTDASFASIGERLGIEEDKARYIYNNAIKKLRRLNPSDCNP